MFTVVVYLFKFVLDQSTNSLNPLGASAFERSGTIEKIRPREAVYIWNKHYSNIKIITKSI